MKLHDVLFSLSILLIAVPELWSNREAHTFLLGKKQIMLDEIIPGQELQIAHLRFIIFCAISEVEILVAHCLNSRFCSYYSSKHQGENCCT